MKKSKKIILATMCLSTMVNMLSPVTIMASASQGENNSYESQQNTYDIEWVEDGEDYEEIIINGDLRASGTYSSTYDMTGGIYTKQSWQTSSTPTFEVSITPKTYKCPEGVSPELTIYLEKKSLLGWKTADKDNVSLKEGGEVTLTGDGKGTYRLYIYNGSKYETTGDIYISYSYDD